MRKYRIYAIALFALAMFSCKNATTPTPAGTPAFTNVSDPDPQLTYKLDIKTKFSDKYQETGAKNGLIAYLKQNPQWAEVVEYNEDYSVWIMNATRWAAVAGSSVTLDFDLELHTAALVSDGTVLEKKHFKIVYNRDSSWAQNTGNPDAQTVQNKFVQYAQDLKTAKKLSPTIEKLMFTAAAGTGNPYLVPFIKELFKILNSIMPSAEQMQLFEAEAVIVGAESYGQTKAWLVAREK